MAIQQISTANTFQQWLIVTQQLINNYNYFEEDINDTSNNSILVFNTANTVSNTANSIYSYVGTAYNTANTVGVISRNAANTANLALATANNINYNVINIAVETTSSDKHYILYSNTATGIPSKIKTSNTSFIPSTETLLVKNIISNTTNTINSLITIANTTANYANTTANYANTLATNTRTINLSQLTPTDSKFIVGDGSNWTTEDGATARASLGLTIGTHVQAYNANLTNFSSLTKEDNKFIVGDGTNWVVEDGATARASLGLTIDTHVQAYHANLTSVAAKTIPSGVIVGTTDTQTLTNKTLTGPIINTPIIKEKITTSVPSTLNINNGAIQKFALTSNIDWSANSNAGDELESGESILLIINDSVSQYYITWPSTMVWVNNVSIPIPYPAVWVWVEIKKVGTKLYGYYIGTVSS